MNQTNDAEKLLIDHKIVWSTKNDLNTLFNHIQ